MKILFIVDSLGKGGKERRLMELLKSINKLGIESEIILLYNLIQYDEVHDLGIKVHVLIRKVKKDPTIFWKINKICKNFKPDIINTWGMMPSVYAAPIAKLNKIRFVNSMIVDAPYKLSIKARIFAKLSFPFSDRIIANSYAGLKTYGIDLGRGQVIYNGFNFERIQDLDSPKMIREKWGIKTRFVTGMVAVFRTQKDYATFITAAIKVLGIRDDITFMLVGEGPTLEETKLLAKGYEDRIIFTGRQSGVESIMNIFDFGVLTTNVRIHGEGISNSILEMMALGKPVIATKSGGTEEIVTDNETGFLIIPDSADSIVNKMIYLMENGEIRDRMGKASEDKILKQFNIDKMIGDYVSLFEEVTGNKSLTE
jgi:glycosyltransferase involved in cell wall biosynthesis